MIVDQSSPRLRLVPMRPRDPAERGRTASNLELFFDLVFVVAVSVASVQLHHWLTDGHVVDGILHYAVMFFAIWWAWMNFTWFATSFATDDWLYRLLTIVQMGGVLVLAAGIEPAFNGDFAIAILAYVVMRVAMVVQWLRASRRAGAARRATLMYAVGIGVVQVLWLAQIVMPPQIATFTLLILIAAELAVPIIAERTGQTPWHPHHITERYGLFTLIVLGESLLASANAIIEALHTGGDIGPLVGISVVALVVTAGLWWIYFWPPHHTAIRGFRRSVFYGYGHYFIFAAAGAFSSGVETNIDVITGHSELSAGQASFAVTIPVAIFVFGIWLLAMRPHGDRVVNTVVPVGAVLILADPLVPLPIVTTPLLLVAIVVVLVIRPPVEPRKGR